MARKMYLQVNGNIVEILMNQETAKHIIHIYLKEIYHVSPFNFVNLMQKAC